MQINELLLASPGPKYFFDTTIKLFVKYLWFIKKTLTA